MDPGLSYAQAPPFGVPLRFFLSAPLFGMLGALGLLWYGPAVFYGRWSPELLGLTHLLTLGVTTMVMCGALLQMLPVVTGAPVPRVRAVGATVHGLLGLGTVALVAGLAAESDLALRAAWLLLGLALGVFMVAAGRAVLAAPRLHAAVRGMRLALAGLGATLVLGLLLLAGHSVPGVPLVRFPVADLHAAWGLIGWTVLLVIAVAYQVVPMFQMTPEYPRWLTGRAAATLFALLVLWSGLRLLAHSVPGIVAYALGSLVALGVACFALVTLRLQAQRKRRRADVTLDFWRLSMAALLLAALAYWAAPWLPLALGQRIPLLLGVVMLFGFALSAINGMLYKIVPFLAWFHLEQRALALGLRRAVPAMGKFLASAAMRRQLRIHSLGCALLVAAALYPTTATVYPAALALLISFALLGFNLLTVTRRYRSLRNHLETRAAAPASTVEPD